MWAPSTATPSGWPTMPALLVMKPWLTPDPSTFARPIVFS
jgi:hypothetical protein